MKEAEAINNPSKKEGNMIVYLMTTVILFFVLIVLPLFLIGAIGIGGQYFRVKNGKETGKVTGAKDGKTTVVDYDSSKPWIDR